MNEPIDWDSLARYLAGECSPAEAAEVRADLLARDAGPALLDRLTAAWHAAGWPDRNWDSAAALARVRERLERPAPPQAVPRSRPAPQVDDGVRPARGLPARRARVWLPVRLTPARLRAAAAVAALSVAGSVAIRYFAEQPHRPEEVMQVLATDKGERARIRLADGTEVTIGPESRLEVPARFDAAQREVRLSGEAYFSVTTDARRPFLVHSGGVVTRVLGTKFNVRAYARDHEVQVVVAEGSVAVAPAGASEGTVLKSGDLARASLGSDVEIQVSAVDLERQLGWLRGDLVFDDTPLAEVCVELERWYGIPVRVGDSSLRTTPLTASFRQQPLEEVLQVIAATLNVTYSRSGRTVLFLPKRQKTGLAL